ncbi:MAG: hypothetical protein KDH94_02900, partial [Coxiellaceae bacterium]|nr:hypothetical protein [Coxiellaceae bacterium]
MSFLNKVSENNLEWVQNNIQHAADFDKNDCSFINVYTAVHYAIYNRNPQILRLLLAHGFTKTIKSKDSDYPLPLALALHKNHWQTIPVFADFPESQTEAEQHLYFKAALKAIAEGAFETAGKFIRQAHRTTIDSATMNALIASNNIAVLRAMVEKNIRCNNKNLIVYIISQNKHQALETILQNQPLLTACVNQFAEIEANSAIATDTFALLSQYNKQNVYQHLINKKVKNQETNHNLIEQVVLNGSEQQIATLLECELNNHSADRALLFAKEQNKLNLIEQLLELGIKLHKPLLTTAIETNNDEWAITIIKAIRSTHKEELRDYFIAQLKVAVGNQNLALTQLLYLQISSSELGISDIKHAPNPIYLALLNKSWVLIHCFIDHTINDAFRNAIVLEALTVALEQREYEQAIALIEKITIKKMDKKIITLIIDHLHAGVFQAAMKQNLHYQNRNLLEYLVEEKHQKGLETALNEENLFENLTADHAFSFARTNSNKTLSCQLTRSGLRLPKQQFLEDANNARWDWIIDLLKNQPTSLAGRDDRFLTELLLIAIDQTNETVISTLLERIINKSFWNKLVGDTNPFIKAAMKKDWQILQLLITQVSAEIPVSYGYAMSLAANNGQIDLAKQLLKKGACFTTIEKHKLSPMLGAIMHWKQDQQFLQQLLEKEIDSNQIAVEN